jgi:hypothetical protein
MSTFLRFRATRCAAAWGLVCAVIAAAGVASAEEAAFPFSEGDVVGEAEVEKLRPWLPDRFWEHRRHYFFPGMQMQIGPAQRDYSPPAVYRDATDANRGKARLGADGSLEGFVAGQPFPMDELDCEGDPDAGTKLIWNFVHRWQGHGAQARFRYVYVDRGEILPLSYEGTTAAWILKHRPEPQYRETGGDVFKAENRLFVVGFEVEKPPQSSGTRTLTYRYEDSFGPRAEARPEDTWIYSRRVRRVRKISESQRSSAVAGTDFTFDDLFTFSGLPPQYVWTCTGEKTLVAPMNTAKPGFPYEAENDYGPTHLSYANDRWELRRAIGLLMEPKDPDHPYSKKEIWLDRQTLQPLYSFAYDRTGALWKIIHHDHRWSEDDLGGIEARKWYPGWEGVPEPRDLRIVSDSILNVQSGTGNRLDFWNSHGNPPPLPDLRRYIDIDRLRRGR